MSDATGEVGDGDVELPDLDEIDGPRFWLSIRTWAFVGAAIAVLSGFLYDLLYLDPREDVVFGWEMALHEWLFVLSLVVFLFQVLVPLASRPKLVRYYLGRLRDNRVGFAAFLYLVAFTLVGLAGPAVVGSPSIASFDPPHQPPVGFGVDARFVSTCAGTVVDGTCQGSLQYPLGTDSNGRGLVILLVAGSRLALEVGFVSAMLIVPLATAVGTVAAEFGGRVDELLMRFVDVQQVVPAFFVYIVAQFVFAPRLTLLLVVFGTLSWGAIARMVRSEAIQRSQLGYVRAAEGAGAGRPWIVRRHVVPNVTSTVVAAVTLQIPTLVLIEAALSFLALGDPTVNSLGQTISTGMTAREFPRYWWISTVPTLLLVVTVVALNLFGDALRDVLDPRMER